MSVVSSLAADLDRLGGFHPRSRRSLTFLALTNRGFHALALYRVSHALWQRRVPVAPDVLTRLAQHLFAMDIAYQAELGPGIVIVHGFGLVIGSGVRIEGDCWLHQGVTLGHRGTPWISRRADGHPVLAKGVVVGAGAKVLGPVHLGANTVVGANAVVLEDTLPNSIVAGVPAKLIRRHGAHLDDGVPS